VAYYGEGVISDRGGLNSRRVPLAGIQCSWEINGSGSASGFVRIADLRAAGLGQDLRGRWLEFDFGAAGRWGGVISGRPTTGNIAEISAEGWAALARGRVATESVGANGPGAGSAIKVLREAGTLDPTFLLLDGTYDEGGSWASFSISGDVGTETLAQISESTGLEWIIDADRRFHAGRKLGRDKSESVRLTEGRHVIEYRTDNDLWTARQGRVFRLQSELSLSQQPTVNGALNAPQWTMIQAEGDIDSQTGLLQFYEEAAPFEWRTSRPVTAPPPWMGVPVGIGTNTPAIPTDNATPLPTTPTQLTVANRDGCWRHLELGNTVRVDLGSIGLCGRFRVMTRGYDSVTGTLDIAGELLGDD